MENKIRGQKRKGILGQSGKKRAGNRDEFNTQNDCKIISRVREGGKHRIDKHLNEEMQKGWKGTG